MTASQSIEYRITRQLLRRHEAGNTPAHARMVERTIKIAAATVGVVLLASFMPELFWVVLAASILFTLGV